jgi:PAS domain S-box-containing protein
MINNYTKAAAAAKIGIWEINLEENSVNWDSVVKQILEVPQSFVPIRGDAFLFFPDGSNRDRLAFFLDRAVNSGASFNEKFQVNTYNQTLKYVECVCQVEMKNEKSFRLLGTFQDITKEQNLITELELSVKKLSSVFSSANDSIIMIDSFTGIITDCNLRAQELTGFSNTELIGLHNSNLFPTDKRKDIRLFLTNQLKKDDYFVKDTHIITKNGTLIPIEVASGKKFMVGNKTYLVCFFRDISERKNAEANRNMLSLVASETTDTIVIANPKGEIEWANNAFINLTGFTLQEIYGKKPGSLLSGPETDFTTSQKMSLAIKNCKNIKVVIVNYNKKREKYWFELNITPVFDDNQNCIRFIGIGRDVTSNKEKEIELQRILEVTNEQNSKLVNFSHIVSHNIRSHTSNLEMVLDIMDSTTDDQEKLSYIDMFREGTQKLSETIEYLNEIIKIQKNSDIPKKELYLKPELERIKTILKQNIITSAIVINDNIPPNGTVKVIPAYLDSILFNLVSNAIKYKCPKKKPTLDISFEKTDKSTIIHFKDNGLGINMERNKHKLFGMYKTFHGNENAKGVGLYLVKNQIEAMKGKIEADSIEGVGTTFKICLYD